MNLWTNPPIPTHHPFTFTISQRYGSCRTQKSVLRSDQNTYFHYPFGSCSDDIFSFTLDTSAAIQSWRPDSQSPLSSGLISLLHELCKAFLWLCLCMIICTFYILHTYNNITIQYLFYLYELLNANRIVKRGRGEELRMCVSWNTSPWWLGHRQSGLRNVRQ